MGFLDGMTHEIQEFIDTEAFIIAVRKNGREYMFIDDIYNEFWRIQGGTAGNDKKKMGYSVDYDDWAQQMGSNITEAMSDDWWYVRGYPVHRDRPDPFSSALSSASNTVSSVANTAVHGIVDTAETVGRGVVDTANKVKDGVVDTANKVKDGVVDVANKVKDGVVDTAKKALKVGLGLLGKLLGKKPQQQQQNSDADDENVEMEVYIMLFGAGLLGILILYMLIKLIFNLIF